MPPSPDRDCGHARVTTQVTITCSKARGLVGGLIPGGENCAGGDQVDGLPGGESCAGGDQVDGLPGGES